MPTNGTGQMVGRPVSLTPAHDKALVRLAALEPGATPSSLVRKWIAVHARLEFKLELKEPETRKPGPKQRSWRQLTRKSQQQRQRRLKLEKGPYRTRG